MADISLLKSQPFGVEIELTGITREQAALALASLFQTTAEHPGGSYDTWTVTDREDKQWKLMSDSSIVAQQKTSGGIQSASQAFRVEMVTPKLEYGEMEKLQEVVRALRHAGGFVNNSTGLHLHIDASRHTAQSLKNLLSIVYSKEEMLFKAFQVREERIARWCKPVRDFIVSKARSKPHLSIEQLEDIWYSEFHHDRNEHYNSTRYHALNYHSVFYRGTVEFRLFNSTLHAGQVRAIVNLGLAISAQALTQTRTQAHKLTTDNDKYSFRVWLLHLGLIGDEFKTTRQHLMEHLDGNSAWRHGPKHPKMDAPER